MVFIHLNRYRIHKIFSLNIEYEIYQDVRVRVVVLNATSHVA
jgi:hypothetical protein